MCNVPVKSLTHTHKFKEIQCNNTAPWVPTAHNRSSIYNYNTFNVPTSSRPHAQVHVHTMEGTTVTKRGADHRHRFKSIQCRAQQVHGALVAHTFKPVQRNVQCPREVRLQSETERGPERSCRINTRRELISARKTSHKQQRPESPPFYCLRNLVLL